MTSMTRSAFALKSASRLGFWTSLWRTSMPLRDGLLTERHMPPSLPNHHWHIRCSWRTEEGRVESHRVAVVGDADKFFERHCEAGHEGEEVLCELLGRPSEGPWVLTRTWFE